MLTNIDKIWNQGYLGHQQWRGKCMWAAEIIKEHRISEAWQDDSTIVETGIVNHSVDVKMGGFVEYIFPLLPPPQNSCGLENQVCIFKTVLCQ